MRNNQSGAVMFFALVAMLGLGAISSAMYMSSMMSARSASNYRNRLESFYAADGLVTKLAQIVIDNEGDVLIQYRDPGTGKGSGMEPVGTYNVAYNLSRTGKWDDRFIIRVKSFKKGAVADTLFPTSLNQDVQRKRMAGWVATPTDTLVVPVTFYDYRYSYRSPDFGQVGWHEISSNCGWENITGMIDSTLDSDRKPKATVKPGDANYWGAMDCFLNKVIYRRDWRMYDGTPDYFFQNDSTGTWYNNCMKECYDYWDTNCVESYVKSNGTWPHGWVHDFDKNKCGNWVWDSLYNKYNCDSCKNEYPSWYFTSHIDQWFRPSGDTLATYDPLTGRWSGLKFIVDGTVPTDTMWFSSNYDPSLFPTFPDCDTSDLLLYPRESDSMENLVFFDSLEFHRNAYYLDVHKPAGTIDSLDPRFNIFRYPYHFYWENDVNDPRWDSLHMGTVKSEHWNAGKFNPLKFRGFEDDYDRTPGNGYSGTNSSCSANKPWNLGWTMELHTSFVYMEGKKQAFKMDLNPNQGYACLWVFINDKLWLDFGEAAGNAWYGGPIDAYKDMLGLESDSVYNLDVFYGSQTHIVQMNIETNLLAWRPAKPKQRFWRRDYGPMD